MQWSICIAHESINFHEIIIKYIKFQLCFKLSDHGLNVIGN